jgi:hypothetical protein
MRQERQNLIDDLVGDLKPVESPGRIAKPVMLWLALATVYSVIIVFVTGPIREGSLQHLIELPLFAGESLLAVGSIVLATIATLRLALPGRNGPGQELMRVALMLAAWVAVYVVGLWYPVHPVSTLGARNACIWQVLVFSLPSLAVLLYVARRQYPLWPRTTGLLAGIAAAAIPAELMQFGCMYDPAHILTHHMSPILLAGIIGAILGPIALHRRAVVPRRREDSMH